MERPILAALKPGIETEARLETAFFGLWIILTLPDQERQPVICKQQSEQIKGVLNSLTLSRHPITTQAIRIIINNNNLHPKYRIVLKIH